MPHFEKELVSLRTNSRGQALVYAVIGNNGMHSLWRDKLSAEIKARNMEWETGVSFWTETYEVRT